MKTSKTLPVLFILAAAVMWGCIGVFVKRQTADGMTSAQITAVRCLVISLLTLIVILATDRSRLKIRPRDAGWFIANGLCSIYVFYTAYQSAIARTSMPTAVALLYTAPAFVLILSVIFFKEKLNGVKILSVVLSIAGSALVSGIIGGLVFEIGGIGLGLLSGLGYALYSIFSKVILKRYHPFANLFYSFLVAAAAGLATCDLPEMAKLFSASKGTLGTALLNGLITGFISYMLYTVGLTKVRASRAAVYASVEPVVATLIGVFVYSEVLALPGVIGICMVIAAILVQNLSSDT